MATKTWKIEKDLCRCCHAEGSFDNLAEPRIFLEKEEIYTDMLRECLDINISPVPGDLCAITYTICNGCIIRLRDACNFKKQVQDCEERFMALYYKNAIKVFNSTSQAVVKEEELDVSLEDSHTEDDVDIDFKKENSHMDDDSDEDYVMKDDEDEISDDVKETTITSKKIKNKPKSKTTKVEKTKRTRKKIKEEKSSNVEKVKKGKARKIDRSVDEYYTRTEDADGSETYSCNLCPNVFKKRDFFKQHYRHVHLKMRPKLIGCYYCEEKVAAHMRAHHLEQVHGVPAPSCGACGKKFSYPFQVLRHQKTYHMGEKKFDCNICDKTFASRGNLMQHKIKHSNDRPFKCDLCEETFKWKKHLRRHMLIHSQKRN